MRIFLSLINTDTYTFKVCYVFNHIRLDAGLFRLV